MSRLTDFRESTLQGWIATTVEASGSAITELIQEINQMREMGIHDDEIRKVLEERMGAGLGMSSLTRRLNAVLTQAQKALYVRARDKVIYGRQTESVERLMWYAIGSSSCSTCVARHGAVRTYEAWVALGTPGSGTTLCQFYCQCVLLPMATARRFYSVESDEQLDKVSRSDIDSRMRQIKAEEKRRGKPYAESTIQAKLGQWRRHLETLATDRT